MTSLETTTSDTAAAAGDDAKRPADSWQDIVDTVYSNENCLLISSETFELTLSKLLLW